MTQRAEGDGKPIPCSGKQQLSCKTIPPGLDALTTARVGICRPMGFRHLRCPKVSKGRAESPLVRPQAHTHCPDWGLTRRLRREWWGCRPERGSTFFRSERKYQRKHAARRLREKGFYCPFWRRGSQCRAQWSWTAFTSFWSALVLAFFRRQNGRAFFPPLPIAALLPHSWRRAHLNSASWDASKVLGWFRST